MTSRSDISSAHAHARGGKRKRCQIGKNCSAACINRQDSCLVELPLSPSRETAKLRDHLRSEGDTRPKMAPITKETRDQLREKIYSGVQEAFQKGKSGGGHEDYENLRNRAIEFNKEIVRQGLENRIKPINVPVSLERVVAARQSYQKAYDSLERDLRTALEIGDTKKYDRIVRRFQVMQDKLGKRIGASAWEIDDKDSRKDRYYATLDKIEPLLRQLAIKGNKKAYDRVEQRFIKLDEWAAQSSIIPSSHIQKKGLMWDRMESKRQDRKIQEVKKTLHTLETRLRQAAEDNDRQKYDRLERKFLKLDSAVQSKFDRNHTTTPRGAIWEERQNELKRIKFISLRDKIKERMKKAAESRNRKKYDKLEQRLLKLQEGLRDQLRLPGRSLLNAGDVWNETRLVVDRQRYGETKKRIVSEMEKAVNRRDRRQYDRLEERLIRLHDSVKDRLKLPNYSAPRKGEVWMQVRKGQYDKIKNAIAVRMRQAARSNNRELYNKLENRLIKLVQAGGYGDTVPGVGERWREERYNFRREKYLDATAKLLTGMREAALRNDRIKYDQIDKQLSAVKKRASQMFGDDSLRNHDSLSLWNRLTMDQSYRKMQELFGPRVSIVDNGSEGSLITTVKGQRLEITFYPKSVTFLVNDSYSADPSLPKSAKYAILKETRRQFNALFKGVYKEGSELTVTPYRGDGKGEAREKEYEKTGFSSPDNLGRMFGRVYNGKITPSDIQSFHAYHGGTG